MSTTKATEHSQDSQRQSSDLDNRYGKIGISAVAAALYALEQRSTTNEVQLTPYDRD